MICNHNWRYSPRRKSWYCSYAGGGCTKRAKNLSVIRDISKEDKNGGVFVIVTSHPGVIDMNHDDTIRRVYEFLGDANVKPRTASVNSKCGDAFEDIDDC